MTFTPKVTQEYGTVTRFKWDLNGDGTWDDSATEIKSLSYKYDQEKEVSVAFYVRDTEGNDASVVKRVQALKAPLINIFSP
jgi:PKD repeat protein